MLKAFKFIGITLVVLVTVAGIAFGVLYAKSTSKLQAKLEVQPAELVLPTDEASIARGHHLLKSLGGCTTCHGPDLGGLVETDIPMLITIRGPNITQGEGSVTRGYTTADWVRSVRHGVSKDGRVLFMMPAQAFNNLSREDLGAIIAAAQSYPPVNRTMEPSTVGPLGHVLHALGEFEMVPASQIDHARPFPDAISAAVNTEYGKYLVSGGGCSDCHRADLSGGRIPGTPPSIPPAANLTPAGPMVKWSEQDFITMFRTGKRPDASVLHEMMPWKSIGKMTDAELASVFLYLKSLPAIPTAAE